MRLPLASAALMFAALACSGEPGTADSGTPALLPDTGTPGAVLSFAGSRPVNLVVVSLDTLRRDRIGWFSGGDTTPVLDARLAQGVVLAQHRACSNWTYPALLCLLSGAYPTDLGFMPRNTEPAPPGIETLAEVLGASGYGSALVGSQYLLDPSVALIQGFDHVDTDGEWSAETVTSRALDAATELAEPWYLHAHYLDPHLPYTAPAEFERRPDDLASTAFDLTDPEVVHAVIEGWDDLDEDERAALLANVAVLYDAEVRYMDHQVGVLLDGLEAGGLLEQALVVLVSDHGEQFYEHNQFEHGGSLYGEETWALASFHGPGLNPAVHADGTSQIDVAPTVLDALGLAPAPQATGAVVGVAAPERPLFAGFVRQRLTVQSAEIGDDRLLFNWGLEAFELYGLAQDPQEQTDLYDADDPTAQALIDVLWPQVERLAEVLGAEVPEAP